jgi:hypothetical protein
MLGRKSRWALVALAAAVLAFVAAGGPAAAKHFIDGKTIKPGTIGSTQLARGAVTSTKLSSSLKRQLTGKAGKNGANGASGGQGPQGARGPAGAFDVVDSQGRTIGLYQGSLGAGITNVFTPGGAILIYDTTLATNYPVLVASNVLFYQQAGCAGTAFGAYNSSYPFQTAIVLESPPSPGSQIYVELPGTPQTFTYQSVKTAAGCANATGASPQAFAVKTAGTVPAVQKPLVLQPAS